MYYEDIFKEFNKKKIKYAVAGGVAVNLYGVERFTHDLDLMLEMDEKNLLKAISAFKSLGYTPKVPVKPEDFAKKEIREKWIKEKNMIVFSFIDLKRPHILIDIIIAGPLKYKDVAKKIKIMISKNKRIKVPVVSINDLIKMKKIAGRLKDNNDIEMLKMAKTVL